MLPRQPLPSWHHMRPMSDSMHVASTYLPCELHFSCHCHRRQNPSPPPPPTHTQHMRTYSLTTTGICAHLRENRRGPSAAQSTEPGTDLQPYVPTGLGGMGHSSPACSQMIGSSAKPHKHLFSPCTKLTSQQQQRRVKCSPPCIFSVSCRRTCWRLLQLLQQPLRQPPSPLLHCHQPSCSCAELLRQLWLGQ
jgi:hypothetical protein